MSYSEAVAWQARLRKRLRADVPLKLVRLRLVAGADVAYEPERTRRSPSGGQPAARFVAAVVVMSLPRLEIVETATASAETSFPYIPGLLSFREGPALDRAFARLKHRPEVVLFDGQGVAHPRGLGLAAHLGILLGCPSVGCAKSRLYGQMAGELGRRRGSRQPLLAPREARPQRKGCATASPSPFQPGERIGTVLRTRDGVKPVWVSCGHLIDLPSAERLVLLVSRGYRLPEPIRAAHKIVNAALRRLTLRPYAGLRD